MGFFLIASPVIVSTATFAVYAAMGQELSAEIIFPALAYFNLLRFPLTFMPMLVIGTRCAACRFLLTVDYLVGLVEAKISATRLFEFFCMEELEPPKHVRIGTVRRLSRADIFLMLCGAQVQLVIDNGSFTWNTAKGGEPTLRNINMNIREGKLALVVGPVGAGKSSIIGAFLGTIQKMQGSVNLSGSVAYASQEAWILNDTLRVRLFAAP